MLSTFIAFWALAGQEKLKVSAGYYRLGELVTMLDRAGGPGRVAADCADDVYAVRIDGILTAQVLDALVGSGRVGIVKDGTTWTIRRSQASYANDAAALKRYLELVRNTVYSVYSAAIKEAAEVTAQPVDDWQSYYDRLIKQHAKTPFKLEVDRLVYLQVLESDIAFSDLGVPALLSQPGSSQQFGKLKISNVLDLRTSFEPDGNLRSLLKGIIPDNDSDTQVEDFARGITAGGKMVFEPITGATAVRNFFFLEVPDSGTSIISAGPPKWVIPHPLKLAIARNQIWSKAEIAKQDANLETTRELIGKASEDQVTALPKRPMLESEALLRWAESTHSNLIAYVSPIADNVVLPERTGTIADIVKAANKGQVDGNALKELANERVGNSNNLEFTTAFTGAATFVSKPNDIWVVRNELGFLDGLSNSNLLPLIADLDLLLRDYLPTLSNLAVQIVDLKINRWRNSFFPSPYLEFCNPTSFRPFAAALVSSPDLAKSVADLAENQTLTLPISKLGKGDLAMREAIYASAEFNDALELGAPEPVVVKQTILNPPSPIELRVLRKNGLYRFSLWQYKRLIWSSWVRNVQP